MGDIANCQLNSQFFFRNSLIVGELSLEHLNIPAWKLSGSVTWAEGPLMMGNAKIHIIKGCHVKNDAEADKRALTSSTIFA